MGTQYGPGHEPRPRPRPHGPSDPEDSRCETCTHWLWTGGDRGECRHPRFHEPWQTTHRDEGCEDHVKRMRL